MEEKQQNERQVVAVSTALLWDRPDHLPTVAGTFSVEPNDPHGSQ